MGKQIRLKPKVNSKGGGSTHPTRSASATLTSPTEWRFFYLALAGLTILALIPVWAYRFLPMQDYPQHLYLARVFEQPGRCRPCLA